MVSRRGRNNFPFELAPRESFHNHDPRDRILLYRSDRPFRFESRQGSWYNSKIGHPCKKIFQPITKLARKIILRKL